jgi:hypothetical protein
MTRKWDHNSEVYLEKWDVMKAAGLVWLQTRSRVKLLEYSLKLWISGKPGTPSPAEYKCFQKILLIMTLIR